VYPHSQIWRPLAFMAALVAATLFATSTIVVSPGDTLSEIAERHDVTVAELLEWNDLDDPDRIFAGATLIVSAPDAPSSSAPPAAGRHVVTAGDTLSAIAVRFGTTVAELVAANRLDDPDHIRIGQPLSITGHSAPSSTTAAPRTHTVVNGDTLSTIAAHYGVKTGVVAADNGISNPDLIAIGMVLTIGAPAPRPSPTTPVPTSTVPTSTVPTTTVPTSTVPPPATTIAPPASPTTTTAPRVDKVRPADEVLLAPIFAQWADVYNVPQDLLEAIAWKESTWAPDAVGPGGHLGIMQLSPDTVDLIEGGLLGREMEPLEASDGIQMGARFLRYLLDRTDSEREATAAWLQGLHSVQSGGISTAGDRYVNAIEEIRLQRS